MQLTPYETEQRDNFLKLAAYDVLADLEETCDGAKSYHYEVHPSNIGDDIYLVFRGNKYYLSDPDSF